MYKRTVKPAKHQGRLFHNKTTDTWEIKPCDRIGVNMKTGNHDPNGPFGIFSTFEEGQIVYVKISSQYYQKRINGRLRDIFRVAENISHTNQHGYTKGYVHHGEPFGDRKHHESVFIEKATRNIQIDEDDVESLLKRLLENIKLYNDDTVNIHLKQNTYTHKGYQYKSMKAKL